MESTTTKASLVVIVGETASGKSALALDIARRFDGEIICADSRTIYKGMNIGTAKPSLEDQSEIPHHLLSVVQPGEPFTAADFKQKAQEVIAQCTLRQKLPIMVGGTGLYVDSVVFDYQFGSKADDTYRSQLLESTVEELYQMLASRKIVIPAGEKNKRHLVRALEKGVFANTNDRAQMRPKTLIIGISVSRSVLRARIEKRVEIMFRQGLRREVEELVETYGWGSEALTGIGYREFEAYYQDQATMGQVKRQIVQNTLQLAKRQRTWFRRNPAIEWVDNSLDGLALVKQFLADNRL